MEYVVQKSTRDWNEDLITAYPLDTLLSIPDQKLQELFLEATAYLAEHEPRHIGVTERYYPTERMREKLDAMSVPADQQDVMSLLSMLPQSFIFQGTTYHMLMTHHLDYLFSYRGNGKELFREGDSMFPDALAKTIIYLLERKIIQLSEEAE